MSELHSMRVMALHELALAEGVPADAVEDAMDDNDPKTVLIRLVTSRRATEPSEAQTVESLVTLLGGGCDERAAAYTALEATRDAALGAGCVGALDI